MARTRSATFTQVGSILRVAYGARSPMPPTLLSAIGKLQSVPSEDVSSIFGSELTLLTPSLARYARRLCSDPNVADDLVQETMLRAWSARAHFVAGTNLQAWTFTILRNSFMTYARRRTRIAEYDEQAAEILLSRGEHQSSDLELKNVLRIIDALPVDQRTALERVVFKGDSYEVAAESLGVAPGTIRSRVARARASLRSNLAPRRASGRSTKAAIENKDDTEARRRKLRTAWREAKASGRTLLIG